MNFLSNYFSHAKQVVQEHVDHYNQFSPSEKKDVHIKTATAAVGAGILGACASNKAGFLVGSVVGAATFMYLTQDKQKTSPVPSTAQVRKASTFCKLNGLKPAPLFASTIYGKQFKTANVKALTVECSSFARQWLKKEELTNNEKAEKPSIPKSLNQPQPISSAVSSENIKDTLDEPNERLVDTPIQSNEENAISNDDKWMKKTANEWEVTEQSPQPFFEPKENQDETTDTVIVTLKSQAAPSSEKVSVEPLPIETSNESSLEETSSKYKEEEKEKPGESQLTEQHPLRGSSESSPDNELLENSLHGKDEDQLASQPAPSDEAPVELSKKPLPVGTPNEFNIEEREDSDKKVKERADGLQVIEHSSLPSSNNTAFRHRRLKRKLKISEAEIKQAKLKSLSGLADYILELEKRKKLKIEKNFEHLKLYQQAAAYAQERSLHAEKEQAKDFINRLDNIGNDALLSKIRRSFNREGK